VGDCGTGGEACGWGDVGGVRGRRGGGGVKWEGVDRGNGAWRL
jgi:hypothetical protein